MHPSRFHAYFSFRGRPIVVRKRKVYPEFWDAAHRQLVRPLWIDHGVNPPKQVAPDWQIREDVMYRHQFPDQWIDIAGNLRNSTGQIVFHA